jgi:hypothetical protein
MNLNCELFFHSFSAIPVGAVDPEASPSVLPPWFGVGFGAIASLLLALSLVIR